MKLKLVFISIDPERDTPHKVKSFIKHFNKNFIGVTASSKDDIELRECMKKFKIYAKRIPNSDPENSNYNIDHTSRIYLMDPENNYLYHIDETLTEQQAAKSIVAKIVSNEYKREKKIEQAGV